MSRNVIKTPGKSQQIQIRQEAHPSKLGSQTTQQKAGEPGHPGKVLALILNTLKTLLSLNG